MQNIGKTIRLLRHEKGWSQEETASQLGISIPAYSKIETGVTDINLSRIRQIAQLFNLSEIDLLIRGSDVVDNQKVVLEEARSRLKDRERDVIDLQKKAIELYEQLSMNYVEIFSNG